VKAFPDAKHKKFKTAAEANAFVSGLSDGVTVVSHSEATKVDASSDTFDEAGWDVVYSDGACKGNGQEGSVAGIGVWWGGKDPR
jgi:ribonuclease HI